MAELPGEESPLKVTVSPHTVYVSTARGQASYADLTFTFINTGPAVSLKAIGIQLPADLCNKNDLNTIVPVGDKDGKWSFTQQGNILQARPAGSASQVNVPANAGFSLSVKQVTLAATPGATPLIKTIIQQADGNKPQTMLPINIREAQAKISGFSGRPDTLSPGRSAQLSWHCTGIDYCIISPTDTGGRLQPSGTTNVSPEETTTYTLNAFAPGVNIAQQCTITVGRPRIFTFGIPGNKNHIDCREPVTLEWSCNEFVKSVKIDCDDPSLVIPAQPGNKGSVKVGQVMRTTVFQLTAYGAEDNTGISGQTTVYVNPPSCEFTASYEGEPWQLDPVTISWYLRSVKSVSIDPPLPGSLNPSPDNLKGSVTIFPQADVSYTLIYEGYIVEDPHDLQKQGALKKLEKEISFKVKQVKVRTFECSPMLIHPKNEVKISWECDAQVINISGIGDNLPGKGDRIVSKPADGTTFTLTAGTLLHPAMTSASKQPCNLFGPFMIRSFDQSQTGERFIRCRYQVFPPKSMLAYNIEAELSNVTPKGGKPGAYKVKGTMYWIATGDKQCNLFIRSSLPEFSDPKEEDHAALTVTAFLDLVQADPGEEARIRALFG